MTHDQASDLAAAHVLGALERSEEAAVRDHLATCPAPHPEFEALGAVVPALLELDGLVLVEPPAALGDRIMAAAAADLSERPRIAASAAVPSAARAEAVPPAARAESARLAFPSAAERNDRSVARDRSRTSRFDWALRIAAVLAIVAIGAWGVEGRRQLDAAQHFESAVTQVIQTASQPGAKPVVLAAAQGSNASGIGAVGPDGSVVLAMRDLPATTGSQVYEAWVIVGKAAPIAVGGFTVNDRGIASFRTRPAATPSGAVIALTLEPNEGNTVPQGPIVSAGVATAPPVQSS